ncbi:phosphatase PAP2 family protein [Pseudovibrio sp. Tun.PSC04-5.I4]|uniref:phosphatase PAP2 family protein n=1 Tax=Pseudovibrio sp. Tun.PSC04-5.I4 TaxID=1798213 RepID=UPI00088226AD|nr:phosphatase PAP2 family protein [Pseudovibrio sp. Tun.PSC04-5.I4]SDR11739.1 undecaprenyl-diphosphatase [Pseudovibrio sp. Tun.PSC04-5.I4]
MSIDDGAVDTLERPGEKPSSQDDCNAATPADRDVKAPELYLEASSYEKGSSERRSVSTVLKSYIRVGAVNFGAFYKAASTIIGNRKARSSVAVPLVPQMLQVQNVAAVLIALCGVAMVFLDPSSPIWARGLPGSYHDVFETITDFGKSDWILFPTGIWILAMIFGGWHNLSFRRKMAVSYFTVYGSYLFFVVAMSGLLAIVLKWNIGRARPGLFDEVGPLRFDFFAWQAKFSSFPSGHSTTAGALIVALALMFPKLRWLIVVIGLWIGASRVLVGAHYSSDVIAGLIVGSVFAYMCARWMARRRLGFRFCKLGRIHPNMNSFSANRCIRSLLGAKNIRPVQGRSRSVSARMD